MKRFQWIAQLLLGIVLVGIGLFIMIGNEQIFVKVVLAIFGALAIISGIANIATMAKYNFGKFNHTAVVIKATTAIIIGVIAIIFPFVIEKAINVFIYLLAVEMALSAIIAFVQAVAVKSKGFENSHMVQEGILSLIISVVLFIIPSHIAGLVKLLMGIIAMIVGATIISLAIYSHKHRDKQTIESVNVEVTQEEQV